MASPGTLDEQEMFRRVLFLQGKSVEVGTRSEGKTNRGVIVYTSPDSFLLEAGGKRMIVRFEDIIFLDEAD